MKANNISLSLAITTYNRINLTLKSFSKVLDDDRIHEIVIYDDFSDIEMYNCLKHRIEQLNNSKIKLFRQQKNVGMSKNKYDAVEECICDYVILLDSDNQIDSTYIDAFICAFNPNIHGRCIYMPEFAKPQFDYRKYANFFFDLYNNKIGRSTLLNRSEIQIESCIPINDIIDEPEMQCLVNTCNYIVPRAQYLFVYEENKEIKETDTYWYLYLWLKANNCFYVVPGMQYEHLVHEGSGWLQNADYNTLKSNEITQAIKRINLL